MHKDDLLIGINWDSHLIGLELEPLILLESLKQ
ncbi:MULTISPECIES: hypothetical protein [Bacillus]|nr:MULTISPECIES: hypothetical protein [Bacillus]